MVDMVPDCKRHTNFPAKDILKHKTVCRLSTYKDVINNNNNLLGEVVHNCEVQTFKKKWLNCIFSPYTVIIIQCLYIYFFLNTPCTCQYGRIWTGSFLAKSRLWNVPRLTKGSTQADKYFKKNVSFVFVFMFIFRYVSIYHAACTLATGAVFLLRLKLLIENQIFHLLNDQKSSKCCS